MGEYTTKEKIINAIKHITYLAVYRIYLWSIGCKSIEEYSDMIIENYKLQNNHHNEIKDWFFVIKEKHKMGEVQAVCSICGGVFILRGIKAHLINKARHGDKEHQEFLEDHSSD